MGCADRVGGDRRGRVRAARDLAVEGRHAADSDALAWIAFVILAVVALLGWTMFAIWFQRRQRGAVREAVDPGTPAEQHFPVPVVAAHGLLAVTTVVLVFLTAIGVGA